ncbi:hypothetical protein CANMA_001642 [Candida margitis]|uniref:uncharacterized protein n=1 Tax=Candida margitis TaxID=1775924 RepID=UPI002227D153|nr:uncharacterized protein CANMA_001642 [Candida margitis]KAI5969322.1 hypothetical protein CANMA_001642 [Candida margitis]
MFDISLLTGFPDEIIYNILDQPCLTLSDIYNFLFSKATHNIAQRILNKRVLVHLSVGKRRNYESLITSTYDYETTCGPYHWHIYYSFTTADLFLHWLVTHHRLENYIIQIFIEQFDINELKVLKLLTCKRLKIYLNYEHDLGNSVPRFNDIVWPCLRDIFNLVENRTSVVVEYENFIDSPIHINLTNIEEIEIRNYFPTNNPFHLINDVPCLTKIILNNTSMVPLAFYLDCRGDNISTFIIKGPVDSLAHVGRFLQYQCHQIRNLVVTRCHLHDFSRQFLNHFAPMGLPSLRKLDLSNNGFGNLENINLQNPFPLLESLVMKFEIHKTVKFKFSNIQLPASLKSLSLQDKKIYSFDTTQGGPQRLTSLDLSYNYPLDFHFDSFEEIDSLNLSYNRSILSSIHRFNLDDIARFIFCKVEELNLQGCNITNEDLESLELLLTPQGNTTQFNSSQLYDVPLSRLRILNLSNNKLSNLRCFNSKPFQSLPLQQIDLSFNAFHYLNKYNFPFTLARYPHLLKINLTGNSRLSNIQLMDGADDDEKYPKLQTMYTSIRTE